MDPILLAFGALLLLPILALRRAMDTRLRDRIRPLAVTYQGEFLPAGKGAPFPRARLRLHGLPLEIGQVEDRNCPRVRIQLDLWGRNRRGWRFEVFPQRLDDWVVWLLGLEDVQLEVPGFDPRYRLRANDPDALRRWLGPAARIALDIIRRDCVADDLHLLLDRGALTLICRREVQSPVDLSLLLSQVVSLFTLTLVALEVPLLPPDQLGPLELLTEGEVLERRLRFSSAAGLAVLSSGPGGQHLPGSGPRGPVTAFAPGARPGEILFLPAPKAAEPVSICQVCGQEVSRPRVRCRSCQAPHHRDCWDYIGRCSTYGCGAKRWRGY